VVGVSPSTNPVGGPIYDVLTVISDISYHVLPPVNLPLKKLMIPLRDVIGYPIVADCVL
jgi:hypothetical protein